MTVREIQRFLEEQYKVEVSADLIFPTHHLAKGDSPMSTIKMSVLNAGYAEAGPADGLPKRLSDRQPRIRQDAVAAKG